jgi:hypothetical protein
VIKPTPPDPLKSRSCNPANVTGNVVNEISANSEDVNTVVSREVATVVVKNALLVLEAVIVLVYAVDAVTVVALSAVSDPKTTVGPDKVVAVPSSNESSVESVKPDPALSPLSVWVTYEKELE